MLVRGAPRLYLGRMQHLRALAPALLLALAAGTAPAWAQQPRDRPPVTFSAEARMGLVASNPASSEDGARLRLVQEIDLTITYAATTDGGLTFGASLRLPPDRRRR